jgi:excisionase family DNA binding protein
MTENCQICNKNRKTSTDVADEISPRWLSVRKACRYTSMSDKTLMRYVVAGNIYGTKQGGKWYIDRYSIDAFFKSEDIAIEETLARMRAKIS